MRGTNSKLFNQSLGQPTALEMLSMMTIIGTCIAELQPPLFSDGERDTMIGLILSYAKRNPPIPPSESISQNPRRF